MTNYRIVANLMQPYTLLILLTLLGLVLLWWKKKESWKRLLLVTVPFLVLVAFSTPAVSYYLLGMLEWPYPPCVERPENVQAVVVLAAGVRLPDLVRREPGLDADTMHRCLHAADLYHRGRPILFLVTGGKADDDLADPPCADLMAQYVRRLGVADSDLLIENRSHTTYENAVESARILAARGVSRIALVTDASHMGRARHCFEKQGLQVSPAACNHLATRFDDNIFVFLPSVNALQQSERFWHEWLGEIWYRLHGRI